MDYNLINLSTLSRNIQREKILLQKYKKVPNTYKPPFYKERISESITERIREKYNEDDMNPKEKIKQKILLEEYIQKISRPSEQIEKERHDYLNSLKYFHGDNEETRKLKKLKRLESIQNHKKILMLLKFTKFGIQNREIKKEKKIFHRKIYRNSKLEQNLSTIDKTKWSKCSKYEKHTKNSSSNSKSSKKINKTQKITNMKQNIKCLNLLKINENKNKNLDKHKYTKKWDMSKCISFSRNNLKDRYMKLKLMDIAKNYNPNYNAIFPNKRRIIIGNGIKNNFSFTKRNSSRKIIYNYVNNNYTFNNDYVIMNLNESERKKRKDKVDRSNFIYGEYLKYIKNKMLYSSQG